METAARGWPSRGRKTTPGIAATAADCAGEQSVLSAAHGVGLALQTIWPVLRSNACNPPPFFGSRIKRKPCGNFGFRYRADSRIVDRDIDTFPGTCRSPLAATQRAAFAGWLSGLSFLRRAFQWRDRSYGFFFCEAVAGFAQTVFQFLRPNTH